MGRPRKRKNEPALLQVKTYLNPQSVTEAEISEFIRIAVPMNSLISASVTLCGLR